MCNAKPIVTEYVCEKTNSAAWLFLNRPSALDAVLRSSPLLAELGRVSRIKTGIILTTSHPPPPLIQTDPTQHPQTDTHHTNTGTAKHTRSPNVVRPNSIMDPKSIFPKAQCLFY